MDKIGYLTSRFRLAGKLFLILLSLSAETAFSQSAPTQVRILAVMAEFQPDADATTVGKGLFDSLYTVDWGNKILDPMPHDSAYFAHHLLFAKNYFNKVSDGKVQISFTVLPLRVKLPKTMKNYSPAVNSNDFRPIGDLMKETWRLVDSVYPSLDFNSYDLFTIFHAGVGRDVSLPGSLGNERDIPSVYINLKSMQIMYGNTFQGISVKNGAYLIKNSMILPQTENREEESFGKKYLTQLSFNGLVAANIASHLTLPDLFDTKTGLSAIGRFGLMDGQAIFAYNGIIPPEPSAWEKAYLGWIKFKQVTPGTYERIAIRSTRSAGTNDTIALKIPINADEYFLLENRQRDALKDGAKITFISNGVTSTRVFPKDTTGFYSYRTDSLYGVIIDVDEFDWAVPGNGIAIWHIDESVIRARLADNSINNDKTRRGIELEEADGIKDIGNQFTTILGDVVTGEGTEEDVWYKGNPARLFTNTFDKSSRPSTKSYAGANSLIALSNFSAAANEMTFRLSYGSAEVKPLFSKTINAQPVVQSVFLDTYLNSPAIFCIAGDSLLVFDTTGTQVALLPDFSDFAPAFAGECIIGIKDSSISVFKSNQIFKTNTGVMLNSAAAAYAGSPVVFYVTSQSGSLLKYSFNMATNTFTQLSSVPLMQGAETVKISGSAESSLVGLNSSSGGVLRGSDGTKIEFPAHIRDFYLSFRNLTWTAAVLLKDNSIAIVNAQGIQKMLSPSAQPIRQFALLELKQDGAPYILAADSSTVYAFNLGGYPAAYFPLSPAGGAGKLLAGYDGLEHRTVLYSFNASGLSAYNGLTGQLLPEYPVSLSSSLSHAALSQLNGRTGIVAFDKNNQLSHWQLSSRQQDLLFGPQLNYRLNGIVPSLSVSASSGAFLPKENVYNYPNPVYGNTTYIRYYVPENASVTIKVFDLSGDLAGTLTQSARGGFENECAWDVTGIQSGVYFAHVEAVGDSGKKESAIIKIVVVK